MIFGKRSVYELYANHSFSTYRFPKMQQNGEPQTPKLDIKMLMLPALFLIQKKVDFTNPDNISMSRTGLIVVALVALSTHYLIYMSIEKKNDQRKIWVPPKAPPTLPFLGQVGEPIKPEDYAATTYYDHEIKLLKEAVQGLVMSCVIAAVMTLKFNLHVSCLMQCISIPLGLFDLVILKKHLLGTDVGKAYNELDAPPAGASSAPVSKPKQKEENVPRVEELDNIDVKESEKKSTTSQQTLNEIDE